jgi:hypothetical protein
VVAVPRRPLTYSLILTALVFLAMGLLAILGAVAQPAPATHPGQQVVSPACVVMVSGTPVPGTPTTLPNGTGTCRH